MTTKQKPLRELKRDTRRVVNGALVSLRDLEKELAKDKRMPRWVRNSVWHTVMNLSNAKLYGTPWWKNS